MLKVYLAAAALAVALGFGWWINHTLNENTRLTEANTALVADLDRISTERANEAVASEEHVKKLTVLRDQRRKENAELSKATAANPDWAAQRIPDDVLRALGL